MLSPLEYYNEQKEYFSNVLIKIEKKANAISLIRLIIAIVFIASGIKTISSGRDWVWILFGASTALFLLLIRLHQYLNNKKSLAGINLSIIESELLALDGDYHSFPDGNIYSDTTHPYSYDLDLYGNGGIYQMLCRAVTKKGEGLLADKLSSLTLTQESVLERQEIIKELSRMPGFLQAFRVAGVLSKEKNDDYPRLIQWLEGDDLFINNRVLRIAILIMPVLSIACIAWSVHIGGVYAGLGIVVLINWILLSVFQKKIKIAAQQIGNTAQLIDKYDRLIQQIAAYNFTTKWMQQTHTLATGSLNSLDRFKKLVRLFDSRGNGMVWPVVNTFFLSDLYCLFRLETWRKKYGASVLKSIDTVTMTDVYISCAVYAFNNPQYTYPEISLIKDGLYAKNLRHPLLSSKIAVGNDVSLGNKEQFYLLTGANMTGKSTFIRTLGVSNVLFNMGLPLPAEEISLPLLELYTSMRITDSVLEDVSYFRAELNRIKAIMDKISNADQPYLVLLDEPLRGTNSIDKQQGTRSIVETLLKYNAIGIIATHDTGLCDLEIKYASRISNYHFDSSLNARELSFDFRLKTGCSVSTNATILMRQMGIIN